MPSSWRLRQQSRRVSDSSSRAVPPPEPPHGSTSTDNGVGGAGSGISLLTSARISTDLRVRSSVVTALPPLTQGLTTILPPGGPSSGQPSHLAPDSNGAFPNADEQMVTTLASPLPPRDTTDHHWAIHLPTPVGPPLDGTINSNTQGARAVPTSQEDNLRPLRTRLPTQPPATSSDSATQNVGVARDAAGNLCGAIATSTGNLAHEAAMASGVPMAARATSLGSDSSRQSHPPTTHPNSGHLVGEVLNVGGRESGNLTTRLPDPTPAMSPASGVPMAARATSLVPSQGRQSHPPTTHPNSGHLVGEVLNVGGSDLETQNTHLPLPLPQPAGPRNGALDGVTTATTGHLSSSSPAELAAMLESAAQTLASSDACVLESQNFRDSVEETASPTVTPLPPSSSSATLPVRTTGDHLGDFQVSLPGLLGDVDRPTESHLGGLQESRRSKGTLGQTPPPPGHLP